MERFLRTTESSPYGGTEESGTDILIGPFKTQKQFDAFIKQHGLVFKSIGVPDVMTPTEYGRAVRKQASERDA